MSSRTPSNTRTLVIVLLVFAVLTALGCALIPWFRPSGIDNCKACSYFVPDQSSGNGLSRFGRPLLFFKEETMLEVTSAATEQIQAYFNGKEVSPIRVFLDEGG